MCHDTPINLLGQFGLNKAKFWPKNEKKIIGYLYPILLKFGVDARNGQSIQMHTICQDLNHTVRPNWPKIGQNQVKFSPKNEKYVLLPKS